MFFLQLWNIDSSKLLGKYFISKIFQLRTHLNIWNSGEEKLAAKRLHHLEQSRWTTEDIRVNSLTNTFLRPKDCQSLKFSVHSESLRNSCYDYFILSLYILADIEPYFKTKLPNWIWNSTKEYKCFFNLKTSSHKELKRLIVLLSHFWFKKLTSF